jgi:hypothetical protein
LEIVRTQKKKSQKGGTYRLQRVDLGLVRTKKASKPAMSTHSLERVEVRTGQDKERKRDSKEHSQSVEERGWD